MCGDDGAVSFLVVFASFSVYTVTDLENLFFLHTQFEQYWLRGRKSNRDGTRHKYFAADALSLVSLYGSPHLFSLSQLVVSCPSTTPRAGLYAVIFFFGESSSERLRMRRQSSALWVFLDDGSDKKAFRRRKTYVCCSRYF